MNKLSTFRAHKVQSLMIVIGLLLIIISTTFSYELIKIQIDHALSSIGLVLIVTGALQWMFDTRVKQALCSEIADQVVGNCNVVNSGISDFRRNSKDVDYSHTIMHADDLIIGLHYSTRLLDDYIDEFRSRCKNGKNTRILVLANNSIGLEYLINSSEEASHISGNLVKLRQKVESLNSIGAGTFSLLEHVTVLRYSFVYAKDLIWIKFYKNSPSSAKIPALKINSGSEMYQFFEQDINEMVKTVSRNE